MLTGRESDVCLSLGSLDEQGVVKFNDLHAREALIAFRTTMFQECISVVCLCVRGHLTKFRESDAVMS